MKALMKDQMNHELDVGAEYPRMLYRATEQEVRQEQTDALARCGESYMVINRFGGLLCDTVIADSADDAETLAADGWETSPEAAYGMKPGLGAAVTAKDEEIAALRAELAARDGGMTEAQADAEPVRRGPGRPPKPTLSI